MTSYWNFLVFGLSVLSVLLVFAILFHRRGKLSKAIRLMVIGHVPVLFYDAIVLFHDHALATERVHYSVGIICELVAVVSVLAGLCYLFDGWRERHG